MYKILFSFFIILLNIFTLVFSQTADDILLKIEKKMYPDHLFMNTNMTIIRGKKTLNKELNIYLKKNNLSVIEFLKPLKERNTRILRVKEKFWIFLPSVQKTIRLSGKLRLGGSDFLYSDILKIKYSIDYKAVSHDKQKHQLTLLGKTKEANYKKIVIWYDPQTYYPIKQDFFVSEDLLLKSMTYSNLKIFEGETRPSRLTIKLTKTRDHSTILDIITYDSKSLPDRLFTKSFLSKGR